MAAPARLPGEVPELYAERVQAQPQFRQRHHRLDHFIIDVDLRKSLTLSGPHQPRTDFDCILRPTLRILDTRLASSHIHGLVTDQRYVPVKPAMPVACRVYVDTGDTASVMPDDICLDPDATACPPADRPLLTTPVLYDTGSGNYFYDTGLIHPGTCTVALVCEADDPDPDDDLLYLARRRCRRAPTRQPAG